ncbi:hypothetical protein [Clostridium tyrobutyricum]|uniref:hypothetical protein n=1 Tax=Clostridium tyrobutyricum TaxID=1519 RepID=UPI001C38FBD0|nr:hypothetical protein [Clostridium tyrobutyricum]MBV4423229.1 hypothetical protein [Clostridium tyrobutyricum]
MKSLKEYFNKTVKIIDIDNKEFNGYVETYTPELDSEDEVEGIAIRPKGYNSLIGFNANEIKSIEVV